MDHKIELVKPEKDAQRFSPGERVIMVDGARWGRTYVHHHGSHGTSYTFEQEGGEVLIENPNVRYPREVCVRSKKKRQFRESEWRSPESMVLEKAIELVSTHRLRNPNVVKAEQADARAAFLKRSAEIDAEKESALQAKAREAIGPYGYGLPEPVVADMAKRIVDAMKWAQTQ